MLKKLSTLLTTLLITVNFFLFQKNFSFARKIFQKNRKIYPQNQKNVNVLSTAFSTEKIKVIHRKRIDKDA